MEYFSRIQREIISISSEDYVSSKSKVEYLYSGAITDPMLYYHRRLLMISCLCYCVFFNRPMCLQLPWLHKVNSISMSQKELGLEINLWINRN